MRVLLGILAVLSIVGCGDPYVYPKQTYSSETSKTYKKSPEELKRDCLRAEDYFRMDIAGGKPLIEAKKNLSPCYNMEDEHFIELAQEKLAAKMKDPSSVQFKETFRYGNDLKVSGKYNAKNGYGAYTGFKTFRVELSTETGKWSVTTY